MTLYEGYTTANKYFKLNYSFSAGQYLTVDFSAGTVLINGSNAWQYVDTASQLLEIPKGGGWYKLTFTGQATDCYARMT